MRISANTKLGDGRLGSRKLGDGKLGSCWLWLPCVGSLLSCGAESHKEQGRETASVVKVVAEPEVDSDAGEAAEEPAQTTPTPGTTAPVATVTPPGSIAGNPVEAGFLDIEELPPLPMAAVDEAIEVDGGLVPSDTPLTLLLVFDTSGSMSTTWGSNSRWEVAYHAVLNAVEKFQTTLTAGAIQFPTVGGCGVAPITDPTQIDFVPGDAFLEAWPGKTFGPSGSTPLEVALRNADAALVRAAELGLFENRVRVLLFSDGEPTCNDDADVMTALPARWLEAGVHTYVVALPGSEGAAGLLDALANAGGTGPDQGGGAAIVVDSTASEIYAEGADAGASRVVVDDDEELEAVAAAAAR